MWDAVYGWAVRFGGEEGAEPWTEAGPGRRLWSAGGLVERWRVAEAVRDGWRSHLTNPPVHGKKSMKFKRMTFQIDDTPQVMSDLLVESGQVTCRQLYG